MTKNKICCLFDLAAHYRAPIYNKMTSIDNPESIFVMLQKIMEDHKKGFLNIPKRKDVSNITGESITGKYEEVL